MHDALVIGAGQSGLAAGYYLQQLGLSFLILEASDEPAGSWPRFYDSLTLNTPARFSALPGMAFPGDPDRYPLRDEVIRYLRGYAARFQLPVVTGAGAQSVAQVGRNFRVQTTGGSTYTARSLVAASGCFGRPYRPYLPGQELYRGQMLHSAEYRRPDTFHGKRVVVVGAGNGALQIGVELAAVAQVTLATRSPLRTVPQRIFGQDIHHWLRLTGLDRTQWLGDQTAPAYVSPIERAALQAGAPDCRPMFKRLSEYGVVWADGREEAVDVVLLATGYRPNLPYLAGLDAIDAHGSVQHRRGVSTTVPGLYYVGLPRQSSSSSATLRGAGVDARHVIRRLRLHLAVQQPRPAVASSAAPR
jgi:putative flavoprotein involved in K+ transport